jgi:hypothetical protein
MARQDHNERNQNITVRPDLSKGLLKVYLRPQHHLIGGYFALGAKKNGHEN